jgi:hypothetical protein
VGSAALGATNSGLEDSAVNAASLSASSFFLILSTILSPVPQAGSAPAAERDAFDDESTDGCCFGADAFGAVVAGAVGFTAGEVEETGGGDE